MDNSATVASAEMQVQQDQAALSSRLGRTFTEETSAEQVHSLTEGLDRTHATQNDQTFQVANQRMKSFMEKTGTDQSHAKAIRGIFEAQIDGGIGVNATAKLLDIEAGVGKAGLPASAEASAAAAGAGAAAGAAAAGAGAAGVPSPIKASSGFKVEGKANAGVKGTGKSESISNDQSKWTSEDTVSFVQGLQSSETLSQKSLDSFAHGFQSKAGEQFRHALGDNQSQGFERLSSQLISDQKSYQQAHQLQEKYHGNISMDDKTFAGSLLRNPEARQFLRDRIKSNRSGMTPEQKEKGHALYRKNINHVVPIVPRAVPF